MIVIVIEVSFPSPSITIKASHLIIVCLFICINIIIICVIYFVILKILRILNKISFFVFPLILTFCYVIMIIIGKKAFIKYISSDFFFIKLRKIAHCIKVHIIIKIIKGVIKSIRNFFVYLVKGWIRLKVIWVILIWIILWFIILLLFYCILIKKFFILIFLFTFSKGEKFLSESMIWK